MVVDAAVKTYIDAIDPERRPYFDRFDGLVKGAFPDVEIGISYQIPTYRLGEKRLYVGVWKHGLSVYGWDQERSAPFLDAHPGLKDHRPGEGKGTIKLRPADLEALTDDDLLVLIRAALEP